MRYTHSFVNFFAFYSKKRQQNTIKKLINDVFFCVHLLISQLFMQKIMTYGVL